MTVHPKVYAYVHTHGYLQVDSFACYVTESGQAVDISSHQADEALRSIHFSSQTFILLVGKSTHKPSVDTHTHTPSKSSLTLPMVLHDRLQAALVNTHTKPNKTCFHAHTHSHRMGLISPVQSVCCSFPKSFCSRLAVGEQNRYSSGHLWS